jgi:hypothetical protein
VLVLVLQLALVEVEEQQQRELEQQPVELQMEQRLKDQPDLLKDYHIVLVADQRSLQSRLPMERCIGRCRSCCS